MHTTVFLNEAVDALNITQGGRYIDATFGEGGHAQLITEKGGTVLGIDADPTQVEKETKLRVVNGTFGEIEEIARREKFVLVDGVLFDFGLSMVQLATGGKGLSYRSLDEPLDMRLGTIGMTAAEYLNTVGLEQLIDDLGRYSEDMNAEKIARRIVRTRTDTAVQTVQDLRGCIDTALGYGNGTDTYARIFQAVRIIVNDEIETIKNGLAGAFSIVKQGGSIVVISFHSVEDRIVKMYVRGLGEKAKHLRINVKKVRSIKKFERSATLRVITKV